MPATTAAWRRLKPAIRSAVSFEVMETPPAPWSCHHSRRPASRMVPISGQSPIIISISPPPHLGGSMKRVTGIGGIFFSAKDPVALRAWYKKHLGIDVQEWGGAAFDWADEAGNPTKGTTAWSIGADDGKHFAPS